MAARSINIMYRCEECTFADAWGRGCEHGLMFPLLLLMGNYKSCPNFKGKTNAQLEEQRKLLEDEKETFI